MAAVGDSRASGMNVSKFRRREQEEKNQSRISILRKPVFRSQPEDAANDSGGGIFKGDGMKSKGRSPDIKPWPSHPGTFFFLPPTGPTNASVGAAVALASGRLIGGL